MHAKVRSHACEGEVMCMRMFAFFGVKKYLFWKLSFDFGN